MSIAAANVITILNRARINFSGMDFSEVHIPNADLSGGLFHRTNFQRSKLLGANFSKAYIAQAQFQNADLRDVELGQMRTWKFKFGWPRMCVSPNNKLFAIACDQRIEVYSAENELLAHLEGPFDVCMTLSCRNIEVSIGRWCR